MKKIEFFKNNIKIINHRGMAEGNCGWRRVPMIPREILVAADGKSINHNNSFKKSF